MSYLGYVPAMNFGCAYFPATASYPAPAGSHLSAPDQPIYHYFPPDLLKELGQDNGAPAASDSQPTGTNGAADDAANPGTSGSQGPHGGQNGDSSNADADDDQGANGDAAQGGGNTGDQGDNGNQGDGTQQGLGGGGHTTAGRDSSSNRNTDGRNSDRQTRAPHPPRFDVLHTINYTPWSPTPGDRRSELRMVGSSYSLSEANKMAMKEVYDKYGGLAHVTRGPLQPPDSSWIRKSTGTGVEKWPNTWKMDGGLLSFSVVHSKLQYTIEGKVTVVKQPHPA
ncbi:hypothetical protein GGS20DRAFT_544779 [Poronia punctata]|nr:hypothetical protein GGS20DRAFT_544779 [Poronia punctata]